MMDRRDFLAANAAFLTANLWRISPGPAPDPQAVLYRASYADRAPGVLRVSVTPPSPVPAGTALVIPRAIPMGYSEAPYEQFVGAVSAQAPDGKPVPVTRAEGPRWRLGMSAQSVASVEYAVDLATMERELLDASSASKARTGYVGLLGYSVFGYLEGQEGLPCSLAVTAPDKWPVYSTLAPSATPAHGAVSVSAADFYALADSQLLLGPSVQIRPLSGPIPLFLAGYVEDGADLSIEGAMAEEAFGKVAAYFGTVPFPHYTAWLEFLRPLSPRHSYGFSMEHLESSAYFLEAGRGLTARSTEGQRERSRFNYAHHIAHAWIPKRGYGTGYAPFSWELAPIIDSIWFSEGFGRYAAIMALAAGHPPAQAVAYRAAKLGQLRDYLGAIPSFIRDMDLVELSRVASTRYAADFRTGQTLFCRGSLMAAEMDEAIEWDSSGILSLKDALRHIVAWCGRNRRGFSVAELPSLITEATGTDVEEIMTRWIRTVPA